MERELIEAFTGRQTVAMPGCYGGAYQVNTYDFRWCHENEVRALEKYTADLERKLKIAKSLLSKFIDPKMVGNFAYVEQETKDFLSAIKEEREIKKISKYPKIGHEYHKGMPKGVCCICGENKSDMSVSVQINCLRGDDDVYNVHKKCLRDGGYKKILQKYVEHQTGGKQ